MSVTKYRDVSDMPPADRAEGEELARRIRLVWARAVRLTEIEHRRGVQKFSSIEEAQRAREQETGERVRRLTEQRRGAG